jgi:hypothetical protein
MLSITLGPGTVSVGDRFTVILQRTLRIPDDGRVYPLPPGLGVFPLVSASDLSDRVELLDRAAAPSADRGGPATDKPLPPGALSDQRGPRGHHPLRDPGSAIIPMYQREALWLGFDAAPWKPNVVKIAVGRINALTGEPDSDALQADPQNYMVCPPQLWLDGVNTGDGVIRQFVAMPLGQGYTIEGALGGDERFGGIQITVYEPRPGRFPDQPPPAGEPDLAPVSRSAPPPTATPGPASSMGLGAGGTMRQKIYTDPYGVDTWDPQVYGQVTIHILNSEQFRNLTGHEPPPTPVSAKAYTERGLPWFDLYDEAAGHIPAADRLRDVKTINERDRERGEPTADEQSVIVKDTQVTRIDPRRFGPTREREGPEPGR